MKRKQNDKAGMMESQSWSIAPLRMHSCNAAGMNRMINESSPHRNSFSKTFKHLIKSNREEHKEKRKINVSRSYSTLFKNFRGTHHPINYQSSFEFAERWQTLRKSKQEQISNLLLSAHQVIWALAAIIMVHRFWLIWSISVYRLFSVQDESLLLVWSGMLSVIIDSIMKIYLQKKFRSKKHQLQQIDQPLVSKRIINLFLGDVFSIFYFITIYFFPISLKIEYLTAFDVIMIFIHYYRSTQIYQSLTIIFMTHKHANYIHLFGFIGKLLIILHLFAILNYVLVVIHPNNNWLQHINKEDDVWWSQYIYALYYTSTTMFTIGYGDIVPQNAIEILMNIFIQIFGVVLIGYIVSQIGRLLLVIREKHQEFEKNLMNSVKISNSYQLNEDLTKRVKNYIVNNEVSGQQLNVKQENNFLLKLTDQLRNQVNFQNHTRILKSCGFFISHWSIKLIQNLSKRLNRAHFSPNERILDCSKLYIVTKGKLQVYAERRTGNKIFYRKHLKTIQTDSKKQIFDNIFGVTSFYTHKPSRLNSISNAFTVCYTADFSDLHQIIQDSQRDFEYFHRRKAQLLNQQYPQKIQAPNFISNRHQYYPLKQYILKKYKVFSPKNQRKLHIRKDVRLKLQKLINYRQSRQDSQQSKKSQEEDFPEIKQLKTVQIIKFAQNHSKRIKKEQSKDAKICISYRNYWRRRYLRLQESIHQQYPIFNSKTLQIPFQLYQQYSEYFPKANISAVLKQMNKVDKIDIEQVEIRPSKTIDDIIKDMQNKTVFSRTLKTIKFK